MQKLLKRLATAAALGAAPVAFGTTKAIAQSYPIDCAILLCLSGGWPASAPCARARGEFIRRITPWPVEPPLQIWRCPMGASYQEQEDQQTRARFFDILFDQETMPQSPAEPAFVNATPRLDEGTVRAYAALVPDDATLLLTQSADIDISGPEFDFVRSIRVYDVRYAQQYNAGKEGGCIRSASVVLGRYGTQGEFSWERSSPETLPPAHVGLEHWGLDCPRVSNRSVFVDWRDVQGTYGFEQVNY
ncbi:hypothetical protein [Pseudooceanicola atlanticus]|uniref:Secreted protein n=1 Tax=Pseudooceanicola atlanticus TaxID=1461694 RepID=A0A0A0E8A5_9RHOB|nr:hypothetical protein [Pseudooceanicola atlanticus]KGM46649.1 hypothetical protein ATO9_22800 [Pseudooceanicola atlanticus]